MADFSKFVVTDLGRSLIAKVSGTEGDELIFTKVSTSDKVYSENELSSLTNLEQIKQESAVSLTTYIPPDSVKVSSVITGVGLSVGYFVQTVAYYAKSKLDNEEKLFAVTINKDTEKADWMSPNGSLNQVTIQISGTFIISNAEVTSVTVVPDGTVSVDVFNEHVQNESLGIHGSTVEATSNKLIIRDESGYSKIKSPSYEEAEDDHIMNKKSITQAIDNKVSNLATKAELVSFDNSKAQLQKLIGYDYPKFKTSIADTINMVLASSTQASITKQVDGSYLLQSSLNNIPPMLDMIFIPITSVGDQTKRFGISNILLQFFDNITRIFGSAFSNVNYTALEPDECSISEIDSPLEFALCEVSSSLFIIIKRQDNTPIPQANYSINLNIKNRVLRNQDSNLFSFINSSTTKNAEYDFLSLEANGSSVIIKGTITNLPAGTATGFYIINNIIPNYFTLNGDYIFTSGITSSSGKSVQYKVVSTSINTETIYNFALQYTDGSQIQSSDVFTFNLTPDKNFTLNPIYQDVRNVQQLGEALNEKIDKEVEIIVDEKIPDIYDYSGKETKTNKIVIVNGVRKQVYRRIFQNKRFGFIKDGIFHFFPIYNFSINVTRVNSTLKVFLEDTLDKPEWGYQFDIDTFLMRQTFPKNYVGLDYILASEYPVTGYEIIYEYYKDDE